MPTPAGLASIFPQDFLNAAFRIASREALDPNKGAKPGTLVSILNRYNHPGYGSNWQNWLLNPSQYAVLKKPGKETGAKARQFYNSPEGTRLLQTTAGQLGGATDFRSTSYLNEEGLLYKYGDNLIPVTVGGQLQYLPAGQVRKRGLSPDFRENTFFSESGPTKKKWWEKLGPRSEVALPAEATPIAVQPFTPETNNSSLAGVQGESITDRLKELGMFPGQTNAFFDPASLLAKRENPMSSFANFMQVFGPVLG
jgi:hypothetical protein